MAKSKKLVLASGSPRRKILLSRLHMDFQVIVSDIDEREYLKPGKKPEEMAVACALAKARDVAGRIDCAAVVLAADTVVALDDVIFGKPDDVAEAQKMLCELSGRTHTVVTGLAVLDTAQDAEYVGHEMTRVRIGELTPATIEAYIATGEPMDKAGAYGIQGYGGILVQGIEGCFFNVVGLPLFRLQRLFETCGLSLLPGK